MPTKDNFYIKKKSNNYIIYNNARVSAFEVDEKGKLFFELILKYKNIEDSKKNLAEIHHTSFIDFINKLIELNFFDDKLILKKTLDSFKKDEIKLNQIYLHLTNKCNLECKYCYNKENRITFIDLEIKKWKEIILKIKNVSEIILTGGEPLLYRDIATLAKYIKEVNNKIKITILSNGMVNYSDIKYNGLFEFIDKITISCDGLNDDFTERIGFNINQFYKNIQFLQKNHKHIRIEIASVHSKGKLQEILEVQNYCNENKLAFKVTSRLPNNTSKEEIDQIPSKEEKEFIDNSILRTQNKLTKLSPISICGAGYSIMSIDYNGDCYPCQSFHFPELCFGNIVENDLIEIIKSAKAIEFKEKLLNSFEVIT